MHVMAANALIILSEGIAKM
ncbi:hypothetical protein A6R68_22093 [Neotoma lepida]|uniref:Uncharacterized protein n=1 Tax=Neotoma lepida TaxID=56216 RepID=A0A1A6HN60_NEOLE|nr:hypothetical protein A6R68_22093 [Neotoma lepida]